MSRVLARLRDFQDDPLLWRKGAGYVLTARAKEIQPTGHRGDSHLRDCSVGIRSIHRRNRRRSNDATDAQASCVARLAARLAVDAPGIDVRVEPYRGDTLERLENGEIDFMFALSNTPCGGRLQ